MGLDLRRYIVGKKTTPHFFIYQTWDLSFLQDIDIDFALQFKELRQIGIYHEMAKDDAELATAEYWNHRYEESGAEEAYDWFRDWEQLGAWFKIHLSRPDARILHLGCGNSVSLLCLIYVYTRDSVTHVFIYCGEDATQCH